jgi:PAS domain S-box-containing protein
MEDGHVHYILSIVRDVTDEVRASQRASSAEGLLQAALAIGKVGSWVWDVKADVITSDKNLIRLFHMTKEQVASGSNIKAFLSGVHPEDRPRIEGSIQRTIKQGVPFEEEYRIRLQDGVQRWVLAKGKVEEYEGRLLFPGVMVDTTERHELRAQVALAHEQDELNRKAAKILQKRNEELVAISRSKDEFVALASHQLRTPATAVKQYLGMVLQGYAGDITDVQTDMLDKAFESNERQIQIVNQILNAARADTGRLVMTPIPLDLRQLVQGVWADMRSTFEKHHHTYKLYLPRLPLQVMADQGYLRMAIENMLHNASLYTPDGGTITLSLKRMGGQCRLSITDTGVGIRKSDFRKLFAKFSRIHNPLSVQAGGSGIGLYLAAEIVRLHGGRIEVESQLQHGSTFAISLPVMHNTIQTIGG